MLSAYQTTSKSRPDERKSIVAIFDWHDPQNARLTLARKAREPIDKAAFPNMTWHAQLKNERLFIHHERADAFLPSRKIMWILTFGDKEWRLTTAR